MRDHSQTIGRLSPSASKRTGRAPAAAQRLGGLMKTQAGAAKTPVTPSQTGRVVAPTIDFEGFGSFS